MMIGTRYEEYGNFNDGLPFVLHTELERNRYKYSKDNNWHEDLEIQLCTDGCGTVLLNGEKYPFHKNDIIVANSNVVHYTGTDTELIYSCLIISAELCRRVGLDTSNTFFKPLIQDDNIVQMLKNLINVYFDQTDRCRVARLNKIVLELLIELSEHYIVQEKVQYPNTKGTECAKAALVYIRDHYDRKITLDDVSKYVLFDKYALHREFKRLTGQTIIEHLNSYRCIKAVDCLSAGYSVTETASLCGFSNLSFFTKTFKKYIGKLPSEYK